MDHGRSQGTATVLACLPTEGRLKVVVQPIADPQYISVVIREDPTGAERFHLFSPTSPGVWEVTSTKVHSAGACRVVTITTHCDPAAPGAACYRQNLFDYLFGTPFTYWVSVVP